MEIFAQLWNQRIEGIPVKKIANNKFFKVTRPSYFVRVPSYFEALWYPQLSLIVSLTYSMDNI